MLRIRFINILPMNFQWNLSQRGRLCLRTFWLMKTSMDSPLLIFILLLLSKTTFPHERSRKKWTSQRIENQNPELKFTGNGYYNLKIFENSVGRRAVATADESADMIGVYFPRGYHQVVYRITEVPFNFRQSFGLIPTKTWSKTPICHVSGLFGA